MPELPEVETIVRVLSSGLVGNKVVGVHLNWPRTLAYPSPELLAELLPGQQILDVGRRGKYLILYLSTHHLLIHLRMSGDLRIEPAESQPGKHDRLVLDLVDGKRLTFNDPRKFGRAWLVEDMHSVVGDLGPEPLDEAFTPQILHEGLHARNRKLKPLLLDQTFLAGLGNIYVDESLHRAGLNPLSSSKSVSVDQAQALWHGIRTSLLEGIHRNGASIDWVYRGGEFQNYFQVYQRTGKPCYRCATPIMRIVVGQRSTHYCPVCQPLKDSN